MYLAFRNRSDDAIAITLNEAQTVETLRQKYKSEHIRHASSGGYSFETGLSFSEAARHLARITHNIKSIVESIPINNEVNDRDMEEF